MGMYTGLRGSLKIKPKFRDAIDKLINSPERGTSWTECLEAGVHESIDAWLNVHRRNFIPFGAICYLDWPEEDPAFDKETGILTFSCSLKNYEDEIEVFIEMLPVIAISWNLMEQYEECSQEEAIWHISSTNEED